MLTDKNEITVLIADDDRNVRVSLKEVLSEKPYKIVCEASNGAEALSECRKLKPDLAILDIKMPIMSGIEAAKEIRNEKICPCVVMLTAFSDVDYIESASEAGIFGYLTKPVNREQILPTIDIALKKAFEQKKLLEDIQEVQKRSKSHEAVSKAKLLIMESRKCSEQEAFNLIRELSRRKNASMEAVAKGFIEKLGGEK